MKILALLFSLILPFSAQAIRNTDAQGNQYAATGLSYTTMAQVSYTSGVLGQSVFYATQTAKSTITVDNKVNTGTVYVMFSPLSYTPTSLQSTHLGQGMEAVLTGTEKTWRVDDGTWPLDCPWLIVINAAGFKVPLKRTW